MATTLEKQELVEDIKYPTRYYRVSIRGYGGEFVFDNLDPLVYEYWKAVPNDLMIDYLIDPEEYRLKHKVPADMDFLNDDDYDIGWHDMDALGHYNGASYSSAYIMIEQVENEEYAADVIREICDKSVSDLSESDCEEYWGDFGYDDQGEKNPNLNFPTIEIASIEKGEFFSGLITTNHSLDLSKLEIWVTEMPGGDEIIDMIRYDGEIIDNDGGDVNGKSFMVNLYEKL